MRAVVEIATAQYVVEPGQVLVVPHVSVEPGSVLELRPLVLIGDGQEVSIGTPFTAGIVRAEVLEHGKGAKVIVFKKKRRKGYKRFRGHRQLYTRIRITEIDAANSSTV